MKQGFKMTNIEKIVNINLEKYADGYIATSTDSGLEGLFLGGKSFDTLIESIPSAIKLLMRATYGVNYQVKEVRDNSPKPMPSTFKYRLEQLEAA